MAASGIDFQAACAVEDGAHLVSSEGEDVPRTVRGARLPRPQQFRLVAIAATAAAALGVVAVVAVLGVGRGEPTSGAKRGDMDSTVGLIGGVELVTALAGTLSSSAKVISDSKSVMGTVQGDLKNLTEPFTDLKARVEQLNGTSHDVNLTQMSNMSKHALLHPDTADRNDGNLCPDDEEEHATLCYKKCSTLTKGKYPIRTTAFSCCMEEPCSFFNSVFTSMLHPCSGYDVAGGVEGKGCPHSLGTCMPNEEFSLGVCYKKCAVLTNNSFPYRSAASTCCRYNSHLACLDALNTITDPAFDVGGGLDDGHASTPNISHAPMMQLTEN